MHRSYYYSAAKSIACSHIILRLRGYFSYGNVEIDGVYNDKRVGIYQGQPTDITAVSTVIEFAHQPRQTAAEEEWEAYPADDVAYLPPPSTRRRRRDWTEGAYPDSEPGLEEHPTIEAIEMGAMEEAVEGKGKKPSQIQTWIRSMSSDRPRPPASLSDPQTLEPP
jgi:hypothetical protein